MKISVIGCPFATSYGAYIESLKGALEKEGGGPVAWIGSNCGCSDPEEVARNFQMSGCVYFEMRTFKDFKSTSPLKYAVRRRVRDTALYFRARRYVSLSGDAEVVHFQQTLQAYGSNAAFHWIRQADHTIRVVTVHELDRPQLEHPEVNLTYNLADGVIVHDSEMKARLVALGVQAHRIHVISCGATVPKLDADRPRAGLVFYGGHHLMSNKGLDTAFKALAILGQRMGSNAPRLTMHGHYGVPTPPAALELAEKLGVAQRIVWANQIPVKDFASLYQRSALMLLPYKGSYAGLPAANAAANGLPVIATKKAGIPDTLGDLAIWIDADQPEQLADRIQELLEDSARREALGKTLHDYAEQRLSWDAIARDTLRVYEKGIHNRSAAKAA